MLRIVRCVYSLQSMSEEFEVCFVDTGPQCALCGNCMFGAGLDIVGHMSVPLGQYPHYVVTIFVGK